MMEEAVNVNSVSPEGDSSDPEGYRVRAARLGPKLGAEQMGATVYELDPGESICPYHYENVEEEWLLVLTGAPTLRDPNGERQLSEGDLVCFVDGPEGAHKVTNRSEGVSRVLMVSTIPRKGISICVYPDSDKVGVFPPGGRYRMSQTLDYWDGEA
jgi:uncharacterized cupin superfamily protein